MGTHTLHSSSFTMMLKLGVLASLISYATSSCLFYELEYFTYAGLYCESMADANCWAEWNHLQFTFCQSADDQVKIDFCFCEHYMDMTAMYNCFQGNNGCMKFWY